MKQDHSSLGGDSFLDIVANLVGILIILVVVIGAQAASVWHQGDVQAASSRAEELESVRREVEERHAEFLNRRMENGELKKKIEQEQLINGQLVQIRHQLLLDMELSRRTNQERQDRLDEDHRKQVAATARINALKAELRQVRVRTEAVENQQDVVVQQIEHYPTPIAKTVFSDEIHFRITEGRIVHVPLSELVEAMKGDWQLKANRLPAVEDSWNVVGPIEGFSLSYALSVIRDRYNPSRETVQLKRFVLQPLREKIGETIDEAVKNGSQFRKKLQRMIPGKTTVSLWVYPDAYDDLLAIREWLREEGFQTASWPLEYGGLISGGPQGFRTTTN